MVIVQITGGLGNQLFMYAAGRRLSLHHRTPLKLDISAFEAYTLRSYLLDRFGVAQDIATPEEIAALKSRALAQTQQQGTRSWDIRSLLQLRSQAGRSAVFSADDSLAGTYLPEILSTPPDVYLQGYWQSERYFKPIEQVIRDDLRFNNELSGENLALAQNIASVDAVSLHIRRGDYASNPHLNRLLGLLPLEYYQRASLAIAKALPSAHFFVFSDDPDWAKDHLRLGRPASFVAHNGPTAPHEDLRLMSLCRHHIVANSSLSWWGAWLCGNAAKIVIAPAQWFAQVPMPDLVPASWRRL
jgi:hypothetical protein